MVAVVVVAQCARACAPPEVMQLVARRRHLGPADDATVGGGIRVAVHDRERILRLARRVKCGNIGDLLGRGRNGGGRAAVKRGICCRHDCCLLATIPPDAVSILLRECRAVYCPGSLQHDGGDAMSAGLFGLLDDVAALARLTAAAGRTSAKAAGVVIDDTAVTPQYVHGIAAEREVPVIKRIAIGSLRNKLLAVLPAGL